MSATALRNLHRKIFDVGASAPEDLIQLSLTSNIFQEGLKWITLHT